MGHPFQVVDVRAAWTAIFKLQSRHASRHVRPLLRAPNQTGLATGVDPKADHLQTVLDVLQVWMYKCVP